MTIEEKSIIGGAPALTRLFVDARARSGWAQNPALRDVEFENLSRASELLAPIVGYVQERGVGVATDVVGDRQHLAAVPGVEAVARFVQDQERRLLDHRA